MRDLLKYLREELLRQLRFAREACVAAHRAEGVLGLSGDGTWGQVANARNCTTTLMDLGSRCLVAWGTGPARASVSTWWARGVWRVPGAAHKSAAQYPLSPHVSN